MCHCRRLYLPVGFSRQVNEQWSTSFPPAYMHRTHSPAGRGQEGRMKKRGRGRGKDKINDRSCITIDSFVFRTNTEQLFTDHLSAGHIQQTLRKSAKVTGGNWVVWNCPLCSWILYTQLPLAQHFLWSMPQYISDLHAYVNSSIVTEAFFTYHCYDTR